jgi:hypothetical protein
MADPYPQFKVRTMGVDVGKWFHYEITGWTIAKLGPDLNMSADGEVIRVGAVDKLHIIKQLMREFQVHFTVLDKQPEERLIYEFCCEHWGRAKRCHYARGIGSKKMIVSTSEDEHLVSVNRTFWLDTSLGRVRSGRIKLPCDIPSDYKAHLKNIVKRYKDDGSGGDVSVYISTDADHFAHARNYSEMALPLAASLATNQNIRSFL